MSKTKLINIKISEDEYDLISNHYLRMGFELVDISHYEGTHYTGNTDGNNFSVTPHSYDYYECLYKFDMEQRNAKELWKLYKKYKEKRRELARKQEEKNGNFCPTKAFIPTAIILAIIIFPFVPMFFGYDFGEFITWHHDLFSIDKSLDVMPLISAILLAPMIGGVSTLTYQLISFAFTHKRGRLNAMEKIPVLQKEIEELTYTAQNLQNK